MSEFLKNFRAAQNSRYAGKKNPYDGHYYGSELKGGNERQRSTASRGVNTELVEFVRQFETLLPVLKTWIEKAVAQQEEVFEIKKMTASNLSAIVLSLKEIVDFLNDEDKEGHHPFAPLEGKTIDAVEEKVAAFSVSELENEAMPSAAAHKREIIALMKRLRRKGGTYKEIAHFLNEKKVPTFSLHGRWHAQTVHRLCSKK